MNNLKEFLNKEYEKAIILKDEFKKLEHKEWDSLTVLLELTVQISHVYNVFNNDKEIIEINRPIDNLGDELSDVLLQLSYLSYLEKIEFINLDDYENYHYNNLDGLNILLGQLTESLLEKYNYRFKKGRASFKTIDEFIKDRIIKMFIITLDIAQKHNLDMNKEFEIMYNDATNFINRKLANGNA